LGETTTGRPGDAEASAKAGKRPVDVMANVKPNASVVELKFAKEVEVSRPVMLAKAGIQKSLKFLDSGSR